MSRFYNKEDEESADQFGMVHLEGNHRDIGLFTLFPPSTGKFLLKVYAKPEEDIIKDTDRLEIVATFLFDVLRVISS